jgi:DNA-binding NarL/FixJ family response regulator
VFGRADARPAGLRREFGPTPDSRERCHEGGSGHGPGTALALACRGAADNRADNRADTVPRRDAHRAYWASRTGHDRAAGHRVGAGVADGRRQVRPAAHIDPANSGDGALTGYGDSNDMTSQASRRILRVASVESVPLLEFAMRTVVGTDPGLSWVGSCESVASAIDMCELTNPNVLVIGSWADPQWRLCHMVTSTFRSLAVVAIVGMTARIPSLVAAARLHGARALVSAQATPEHLAAAIRIASTGHYLDPSLGMSSTTLGAVTADGSGLRPLSRREFEVLQLIADGRTAEYIGKRLGITADTVRTHIGHILRKLGARDRAHAVARAFQLSLLARAVTEPTGNAGRPLAGMTGG